MDHVSIRVTNDKITAVVNEYAAMLAPLGIKEIMRFGGEGTDMPLAVGMGKNGKPFLWFWGAEKSTEGAHLAFEAKNRELVDSFHEAALATGLECNGKPGVRANYHPTYYAAFVHDSLGNNIEAVNHHCCDESTAQAQAQAS